MDSAEVVPDRTSFNRVARALDAEAGGLQWRRDLSRDMASALAPGVAAARSALLSRGGGGPHEGTPLRPAVAAQVRLVPLSSGAAIVAGKNGIPRGFHNAAKRFNQRRGFRRQAWGNGSIVQVGAPGWFDDTLQRMHPRLRAAALSALEGRARRISRKA